MSQDFHAVDWKTILADPKKRAGLSRLLKDFYLETVTAYPIQSSFDPSQLYIPFRRTGVLLKTWCPFLSLRKLYRYAENGYSFDMLPSYLRYLYAEPPGDYPGWFFFYTINERRYFYLPCALLKTALVAWAEEHRLTVPAPTTPVIRTLFEAHPPSCPHEIDDLIKHCQPLSKFQRYRLKQHLSDILKARTRSNARINASTQQGETSHEPLSTARNQHAEARSEGSGTVPATYSGATQQIEGPHPAIRHPDSAGRAPS